MAITRAQQYRQMLREGSVAMQGGVKNYLGKQKTVSDVPVKWQSGKDKPSTELAYITDAEKKLLLKEDIHGSLKDGPNTGPEGIISLDSQGDMGGSEDKGTNADGSNNPGYDAQADLTDYATNVGKTAKSKGGFKGDGGGGVKDFLGGVKNYVLSGGLIGATIKGLTNLSNKFGKTTAANLADRYGYGPDYQGTKGPSSVNDGNDDSKGGGGGIVPYWAQLGFPSEEAYLASGAVTDNEGPVTTAATPRIAYRLMNEGGMADDKMPYEGGIMDLESSRQMYGLGKLVKKVTRSVKKIAKSPIGKTALLAAVGFGIPGTSIGGLFGRATFGGAATGLFGQQGIGATLAAGKAKFLSKGLPNLAKGQIGVDKFGNAIYNRAGGTSLLDMIGGKVGAGIFGASALAGLMTPKEQEEQEELNPYLGEGLDIADIRSRPSFYQGQAYRLMSDGGSGDLSNDPNYKGWVKVYEKSPEAAEMNEKHSEYLQFYNKKAEGGSMKEPVAKKVMPLLDMDGQEMDFRAEGGFVPIGRMEKADDVPARLSKNEFVFTADAVRNAGEGDVDKGAEVMYNMMKNLESGGEVSEESQGLDGARKMFQTSQRLEEVL